MKEYLTRQSQKLNTEIFTRLLQLLTENKRYTSPDVTAAKLAAMMGGAPRNISVAVQNNTGQNFSHLLNTLRLREACRKLTSPRYKSISVEEIGLSCGYKSRQAYYIAFQRHMKTTPAEYRVQNSKS